MKANLRQPPRLVEPRAQREIGERLGVLILDEVRADRAPRSLADSLNDGCQLASNFDSQSCASFVLNDLKRAVTKINAFDLEYVCRSLTRE